MFCHSCRLHPASWLAFATQVSKTWLDSPPDIVSSKKIHLAFGKEPYNTDVRRNRKLDGLEILYKKSVGI